MADAGATNEAYNRGRSAGDQAARAYQPRAVDEPTYQANLGGMAGDPDMRSAFESGFYQGYDAAKAGMAAASVPGPSAPTTTTTDTSAVSQAVLDDANYRGRSVGEHEGQAHNPRVVTDAMYQTHLGSYWDNAQVRQQFDQGFYGAYDTASAAVASNRQTYLASAYEDFDGVVKGEMAGYDKLEGGLAFLNDWQLLRSEWNTAKGNKLNDSYLEYYEQKLHEMKQRREGLQKIEQAVLPDGTTKTVKKPAFQTLPPYEMPSSIQKQQQKPGVAPVGAKILGLPRTVAYVLGAVAAAGAIAGGIYLATRKNEEVEMEKGPDGVWRPKPKPQPGRPGMHHPGTVPGR